MNDVDALYPFDPELEGREHELALPEKLRALRDRTLAQKAYVGWMQSRGAAPARREEPKADAARPAVDAVAEAEELERRYR